MRFTLIVFSTLCFSLASFAQNSGNLHLAVVNGDLDQIRSLIQAGVEVDATMSGGWTPLMVSAKYGKFNVMETLINADAKVDLTNLEGNTALMVAVTANQIQAVKILLASGANVSKKNRRGLAAEDIARILGYTEIMRLLDEAKASTGDQAPGEGKGDKTG